MRRAIALDLYSLFLVGIFLSANAVAAPANLYRQTNLVSNVPGKARHIDINLINPWDIACAFS